MKIMPKTKYRGLNTKRGKCAIKKDQSISANSKCNINFVNVKIHFSRSWPRILVYMIKAVRVIQLQFLCIKLVSSLELILNYISFFNLKMNTGTVQTIHCQILLLNIQVLYTVFDFFVRIFRVICYSVHQKKLPAMPGCLTIYAFLVVVVVALKIDHILSW